MGLFNKRLELKKEYFESYLNLGTHELANYRKRRGFKFEIENSSCKITVNSFIGGFQRNVEINNHFWKNGELGNSLTIRNFTSREVVGFLDRNFKNVNDEWIQPDGDLFN